MSRIDYPLFIADNRPGMTWQNGNLRRIRAGPPATALPDHNAKV
jgi:hypothetical protein